MMPVARRPRPSATDLDACLADYEQQATCEDVGVVWKRFRSSACGRRWFDALERAYGARCVYCDHAPGRTIDHCSPKSKGAAGVLAWRNWRVSCGDCNRLKGARTIIDPVRQDPRDFIIFDVTTGAPQVNPAADARRRKRAELAVQSLDHQTLNDARRAKRHRTLDVMSRFVEEEGGYDAARVLAELAQSELHRAILRDLILDAEADLHLWAPLVREVIRQIPELRSWALAPLAGAPATPPRGRPRRRAPAAGARPGR